MKDQRCSTAVHDMDNIDAADDDSIDYNANDGAERIAYDLERS